MAFFSGSSGDGRRPLGPRPFSGRDSTPKAPVLRPHSSARRNTAAPFPAIPDEAERHQQLNQPPHNAVAVEPGSETAPLVAQSPATDHIEAAERPQERAQTPSVLRVADIWGEPQVWTAEAVTPVAEDAAAPSEPDYSPVIEAEAPEAATEAYAPDSLDGDLAAESLALTAPTELDDEAGDAAQPSEFELAPLAAADEPPAERWEARDEASANWASPPILPAAAAYAETGTLEQGTAQETQEDRSDHASVASVPDDMWWTAPTESQSAAAPVVPVADWVPNDASTLDTADLQSLVTETEGAERAVEMLEAVARMVRSREIVVSVGAGASAESVLASILASLLLPPS